MAWRCEAGDWHVTGDIDFWCPYCETPICWHNGGWRFGALKLKRQQCDECRREELMQWREKWRNASLNTTSS
jgi:hypothetical protein